MKNKISKIIDKRSAEWPDNYDDWNIENYQEYFIKGTNIKLGFTCYNKDIEKEEFYCIVTESYDDQEWFDTEKDLFEHFEYILMNKDFSWRYYY